jgi:hypothetical protein
MYLGAELNRVTKINMFESARKNKYVGCIVTVIASMGRVFGKRRV